MKNIFRISVLTVFVVVALLSLIVPAKTAQAATRFTLVKTIISPTSSGGGFFGQALAADCAAFDLHTAITK